MGGLNITGLDVIFAPPAALFVLIGVHTFLSTVVSGRSALMIDLSFKNCNHMHCTRSGIVSPL